MQNAKNIFFFFNLKKNEMAQGRGWLKTGYLYLKANLEVKFELQM